jgi:hypothetical protein
MTSNVKLVLLYFYERNLSFSDILLTLLSDVEFSTEPVVHDLKIKSDAIVAALLKTQAHTTPHTQQNLLLVYKRELTELVRPDNGAHFNAASVSAEQLESFRVDETAAVMAWIAPFLWDLLDTLLLTHGKKTNVAEEGEDQEYWELMNFPEDSDELEQVILNITPGDRDHNMKKHRRDQRSAIIEIVSLAHALQWKAHKMVCRKRLSFSALLCKAGTETQMPCKVSSVSFSNQARHPNGSSILLRGLGFQSLLGQSIEQSIPYHLNLPTTYKNLDKHFSCAMRMITSTWS